MSALARKFVVVALSGCLLGAPAAAVTAAEPREVKDPHFGAVLFDFFQENYFSALTTLMTAQHFARVPQHADEAELLRGGILLSYGLHEEAGRIFQALIDAGAPPPVRDRAWFFVAKIRYQRGYLAEAEDAVGRIGSDLPGEMEDERRVLHAQLLQRRGQYAQAVEMLRRVSRRSDWSVYGRYNLGVALVAAGERLDGLNLLDEIGRDRGLRKRGEEMAALSDKANVALGYVYLREDAPLWAKGYLDRVRLDGLMSNKALLGLGWAHASYNEHQRALVPWTELTRRAPSDSAVQEALLAVPYSLGKLGAYRQSLEKYEQALAAYTREIAQLDESMQAIRGGALIENILRANPGEESGWFWRIRQLPDSPEARYLSELLASHDFQEGLKNYRDIRFLIANLDTWSRNAQVFDAMLATRRQAYAERLPRVLARERALGVERLQAEQQRYRDEFARAEQEGRAEAFANDKERALLARLDRAQAAATRLPNPAEREAALDKHRLLRGLLLGDLSARMSERAWQAKKDLNETDKLIAQMQAQRQALLEAQREAPAVFDAFASRIGSSRARITRLQAELQGVARAQENHLATLAVDELARRREQLLTYITQARFAVAQIYDEAVRTPQEGPKP